MWSLVRVIQAFQNRSLDGASLYGASGELLVQGQLMTDEHSIFVNKIVPHPTKKGFVLEMDIIVCAEGSIFCVEVKNYKGRISFLPLIEKKGFLGMFFPKTVGYDERRIVKYKDGNYGEATFEKDFINPINRTKSFINALKKSNQRLAKLYFIPVVAFIDNEADISKIHSFEKGLIYASELGAFFKSHRNERFSGKTSQWILNELSSLSTWDNILTRKGEYHYGKIKDNDFSAITTDGYNISIPLKSIEKVITKRDGILSEYDSVVVKLINGEEKYFNAVNCSVNLERFGKIESHYLRNINEIIIGTQKLRE